VEKWFKAFLDLSNFMLMVVMLDILVHFGHEDVVEVELKNIHQQL